MRFLTILLLPLFTSLPGHLHCFVRDGESKAMCYSWLGQSRALCFLKTNPLKITWGNGGWPLQLNSQWDLCPRLQYRGSIPASKGSTDVQALRPLTAWETWAEFLASGPSFSTVCSAMVTARIRGVNQRGALSLSWSSLAASLNKQITQRKETTKNYLPKLISVTSLISKQINSLSSNCHCFWLHTTSRDVLWIKVFT